VEPRIFCILLRLAIPIARAYLLPPPHAIDARHVVVRRRTSHRSCSFHPLPAFNCPFTSLGQLIHTVSLYPQSSHPSVRLQSVSHSSVPMHGQYYGFISAIVMSSVHPHICASCVRALTLPSARFSYLEHAPCSRLPPTRRFQFCYDAFPAKV